MITLLIGENSFEIERALAEIAKDFSGEVEKIDGSVVQSSQLPDILTGISLFADQRLVVIRALSENRAVWNGLADWLPRVSDDIHLVMIEAKPDKRTVTFKALKGIATVREFAVWTDRDTGIAEKWAVEQAKKQGFELDKKCVQTLVQWVGVDQWALFHALEKLALTDEITPEVIKNVVEPNPIENVFNLFETALSGDTGKLTNVLKTLEQTEDVFRLTALLFSQAFQLAAVVSAESAVRRTDNVARDFGIHPYAVQRLTSIAKRLNPPKLYAKEEGNSGISKIISIFTELDDDMKISRAEPWLLVERALIKVANI